MTYPDPAEVADTGGARPVAQLKYVDTVDGGMWITWRWEHALDRPRIWGYQPQQLAGIMLAFAPAVPEPRDGETVDDALARSWAILGDLDREKELMTALAPLIPQGLAAEINHFLAEGLWPHLRIQPSRRLARVPWEALRVDEGERMVHDLDVSVLLPASVRNAPRRRRAPEVPGGPVAAAISVEVPGRIPELGDVLRRDEPVIDGMFQALGGRAIGSPHGALSREGLREALAGAARFVYAGHVTPGVHGLDTAIHLTDGPGTAGRGSVVAGVHRPLTAADIVFDRWDVPARVALIGCASGGDAAYPDPTGLVAAMVARGARVVTSARWSLPTDVGIEWLASSSLGSQSTESSAPYRAFAGAVIAASVAHDAEDPVHALNAWQRAQADAWERTGDPAHTPLIWAGLTTALA
ncbi:CHAT domain-containing protein [Microbacterium indicum]|uniref:CHAT domain-containing protein n=1 Tax=Microbacterium indicum TaxID=358100 RepID=UPI0012EC3782|nr:CHAT domain-containing protein [Microbacterium indicum]